MVALRGGIVLEVTEAGDGVEFENGEWQEISVPTTVHDRKTLTF